MKPEEERKLENLLDAVARRYAVQAPEDLGRRLREALEEKAPASRVRVWQPAFALLFVGLGAGLVYVRLGSPGGEAEFQRVTTAPVESKVSQAEVSAPGKKAERLRAPAKGTSGSRSERAETAKKSASLPAAPASDRRAAPPAPAYAEAPEEGDLPSTTAFEERGGDAYLASEAAETVARPRSAAPAPASAPALLPPSYAEHMESAARFLAAGREDGALTYWNAALERLSLDKSVLPRPRDLELSLAWLSRGRKEPPLALLLRLRGRPALTVSPAKLESWIQALEKGETQALESEWRRLSAASEGR